MKKTIIITILAGLVLEAAGAIVFMYSGAYNVSMLNHDNAVMNWFFDTGSTRSVEHHAADLAPPELSDPARIKEGAGHFDEMCVQCHGGPGEKPGEIAQGLWPKAPDLGKAVDDWTPPQLFWIVKNGIKFSAMPAWGPSHSDEKIWSMVAFLEKMPQLTPEEYRQMTQGAGGEDESENERTAAPKPGNQTNDADQSGAPADKSPGR